MLLRRVVLSLSVLLLAPSAQAATVVVIPVPAPLGPTTTSIDIFFDGLNGTVLNGASLSIDFLLGNNAVIRADSSPDRLSLLLTLFTNAPSFTGNATAVSGYVIDTELNHIGSGSAVAQSSDGSFTMSASTILTEPTNLLGLHLDFTMPTSGFVVTNGSLRVVPRGTAVAVGDPQQLPEPSTLLLSALGALALLGRHRSKSLRLGPARTDDSDTFRSCG